MSVAIHTCGNKHEGKTIMNLDWSISIRFVGIQACGLHPLEISFKNHHLFQESHPLEEEVVFLFLTMFVSLVSQADEGYDWGKQYDELMGAFMASMEEAFGKGKEKVDEANEDLLEMIDKLKVMNAQLIAELMDSTEANKKLILREKSFDKKIIDLGKENEDLKI
ncbi:hypothetical protein R6Q59_023412 [Mikania micrantha]